jgi:hypothetical protein
MSVRRTSHCLRSRVPGPITDGVRGLAIGCGWYFQPVPRDLHGWLPRGGQSWLSDAQSGSSFDIRRAEYAALNLSSGFTMPVSGCLLTYAPNHQPSSVARNSATQSEMQQPPPAVSCGKRSAKLRADLSVLDRFNELSYARDREAELRGRPGTDFHGDRRRCIERSYRRRCISGQLVRLCTAAQ